MLSFFPPAALFVISGLQLCTIALWKKKVLDNDHAGLFFVEKTFLRLERLVLC